MPARFPFVLFSTVLIAATVHGFSIREMVKNSNGKRSGSDCPPYHPFQCPNGDCVPIKYLCDGSADCTDGYDENESMCTAALRPPVEETAAFLKALLTAHGPDFLVKVFGKKAAGNLQEMGGPEKVAVELSESPTMEVFGQAMGLSQEDVSNMVTVMQHVIDGETGMLTPEESADFSFFVQKLHETGFF